MGGGGGHQGPHVLGEAGAAVAGPGAQVVRADPRVQRQGREHVGHIGAHRLGEMGHGVHEGEPGGQVGVGGVLGEFGGGRPGEQHRGPEGGVQLPHQGRGPGIVGAHHHPIGLENVLNRPPLLQELRVDHQRGRAAQVPQRRSQANGRPRGHRRLDHQRGGRDHGRGHRPQGGEHEGEVDLPARAFGGGDRHEHRLRPRHRVEVVAVEGQPAGGHPGGHQFGQAGLGDGDLAGLESGQPHWVGLPHSHRVPGVGEAGGGGEAHVAGAQHGEAARAGIGRRVSCRGHRPRR